MLCSTVWRIAAALTGSALLTLVHVLIEGMAFSPVIDVFPEPDNWVAYLWSMSLASNWHVCWILALSFATVYCACTTMEPARISRVIGFAIAAIVVAGSVIELAPGLGSALEDMFVRESVPTRTVTGEGARWLWGLVALSASGFAVAHALLSRSRYGHATHAWVSGRTAAFWASLWLVVGVAVALMIPPASLGLDILWPALLPGLSLISGAMTAAITPGKEHD